MVIVTVCSSTPPTALGIVEGQKIEFIKGSYEQNRTHALSFSPDELVKYAKVNVVKQSAELTLDFKGRDPDYFSIELWKDRTNAKLIQ